MFESFSESDVKPAKQKSTHMEERERERALKEELGTCKQVRLQFQL